MTTMRITVLGANGPTGRQVVDQALAAGDEVVAVTRRPESFAARPGLDVVAADVREPGALDPAVKGADAVVSALGVPFGRQPIDTYSAGTANALEAMRRHDVRRIVVVSSTGLHPGLHGSGGFVFDHVMEPFVARVLARTLYADVRRMEALLRESDTDWTIARASGLFDTPAPTAYELTEDRTEGMHTSRADLAAAMLAQLRSGTWVRRTVAVTTTAVRPNMLKLIWREAIARPGR